VPRIENKELYVFLFNVSPLQKAQPVGATTPAYAIIDPIGKIEFEEFKSIMNNYLSKI
jgi:hypothetical protein